MSTRSRVGIMFKDGSIKSAYVHHDGYLSGVGQELLDNYQDPDDVWDLIQPGDMSVLGDNYYHDRGEDWESVKPRRHDNIEDFNDWIADAPSCEEYVYLYGKEQGEWIYSKLYQDLEWKLLTQERVEEDE